MKTKIILIRHGESLGNMSNVLLGHTDKDLSPLGYLQAEAAAKALENEKIDAIYSSDLLRAVNTAVPHAKRRGLEVIPDRELRELFIGDWEGMNVFEVIEKYGEKMFREEWIESFGTFRMPGGESTWDAGTRFLSAVERIANKNQGKTVLIAAHAAVIRSFFAHICGLTRENMSSKIPFPSNASYSTVCFENGAFTPIEYSVDDYLRDVGITKVEW